MNYKRENYQEDSQFCAAPIEEKLLKRIDLHFIDILHGVFGIAGEISEIHEAFDDVFYDDRHVDLVNLQEEMGDICWYIANLSNALGYTPSWEYYPNKGDGKPDYASFLIKVNKLSKISGKMVDSCKRKVYYGVEIDEESFKTHIDSIIKVVCQACENLTTTLENVQEKNVNKLRERYGDKFSEKSATERNLDKEREILENE